METLEFVIYPDGRVKELVTGIVGASCADVTAANETEQGQNVSHQKTADFYKQSVVQNQRSSSVAQVSTSQW